MIERAIESYERSVQLAPNTLLSLLPLAGLYAQVNRDEQAKEAAKEVRRIAPDYTWDKYGKPFRFNDKDVETRFFDGLRKVGLK